MLGFALSVRLFPPMSNGNSKLREMFSGSARRRSGGAVIKVFESNRNREIEGAKERELEWEGENDQEGEYLLG